METSPVLLRAAAEKAVQRLRESLRQAEQALLDIDYDRVRALLREAEEKAASLPNYSDDAVEAPAREIGRLASWAAYPVCPPCGWKSGRYGTGRRKPRRKK